MNPTDTERASIVAEARRWLATPFHHQGRVLGVGVDCAGVAVEVAKACGMQWSDRIGYARIPSQGQFVETVHSATDPVDLENALPGDLMVFAWRTEPQHIAIVSSINPLRIIHAWEQVGKCVENDLDAAWRGRLVECRRYRRPAP